MTFKNANANAKIVRCKIVLLFFLMFLFSSSIIAQEEWAFTTGVGGQGGFHFNVGIEKSDFDKSGNNLFSSDFGMTFFNVGFHSELNLIKKKLVLGQQLEAKYYTGNLILWDGGLALTSYTDNGFKKK